MRTQTRHRVLFSIVSGILIQSLVFAGPLASASASSQRLLSKETDDVSKAPKQGGASVSHKGQEGEKIGDDAERRRDATRLWFGGEASPDYLRFKNALAEHELEAWGHLIPGAHPRHPLPLPPNTAIWRNIGPFGSISDGSGTAGGSTESGRPQAIVIDPANAQHIYMATSGGGVFKCFNADINAASGAWTWQAITDGLPTSGGSGNIPVGGMAMSPANANRLYIGMGDPFDATAVGFYYSTDAGTTWIQSSGLGNATRTNDLMALPGGPNDIVLWGTNDGLKRSTDGGLTFTTVTSTGSTLNSGNVWSLQKFSATELICSRESSGGTGSIWYSSDAGANWTQATITGASGLRRITVATTPISSTVGYGMYENAVGDIAPGVLVTADKGHSWTLTTGSGLFNGTGPNMSGDGGQGFYNHMISVDPTNASTLFVAANLAVYRSQDSGANWTQLTHWYGSGHPYAHADNHCAAWAPGVLYVGNDGGLAVYKDPNRATIPTTSSDLTFLDNRRNQGISDHLIYNIGSTQATTPANSKYRVSAGLQDNGSRVRFDETSTTSTFVQPTDTSGLFEDGIGGDGFGTIMHPKDGQQILATLYYTNIYKSVNGGVSFSQVLNKPASTVFFTKVEIGRADATGNTALTFDDGTVYESTTNFGQSGTWNQKTMTGYVASGHEIRWVTQATTSASTYALVCRGGTGYVTTNNGTNWTQFGAFPAGDSSTRFYNMAYVWFDTTNASTLYASSVSLAAVRHLWKSTDSGANWTHLEGTGFPSGIPVHCIQNDPTNNQTLLAGTDFGVYRSADGGANWSRYGAGLPVVAVRDIYVAPDGTFVRIGTFGRGVWELDTPSGLPTVTITSPATSLSMVTNGVQPFIATSTGAPNTNLLWTASAGSIPGAAVASGASVNFTAPAGAQNGISVTATAQADGVTNVARLMDVVAPASVNVVVTPGGTTNVQSGATQTFSAAVTASGTAFPLNDQTVAWSLSPAGPTSGAISGAGLYTAPVPPPASPLSVTVTATSNAAPTRTGTTMVSVPAVSVSITPTPVNVPVSTTQQFTPTVTGSTNTAVTWSLFSGTGSVNGTGLYTAPGATGSAVVRATSVADNTKFADAAVTVVPIPISVTVSPNPANLVTNQTQQFSAAVANTVNTNVTWSVFSGGGVINGTGLYTAPATAGSAVVRATSVADNTKFGDAAVSIQVPVTIGITPTVAYVQPNGNQTFVGTPSQGGTTYSVVELGGGSITALGVYTAPATPGDYHVKATAQADLAQFATATVHVQPLVVAVNPPTTSLQTNTTQQFTSTVTGNPNTGVTWSVVEGGGGTVNGTGLYTAPAVAGTYHVRATSTVDITKFSAATVTVTTVPVLTVSVTPPTVSLAPSGTQGFTATVTNGPAGVSWSVDEIGGGTVNSVTGAYTAPAAGGTYHVRATSTSDTSKSGVATVTVVPPVTTFTVSVNPATGTILTGATATLIGTVNTGTVNWTSLGGGTLGIPTGTTTSTIVFTAPSTPGSITITATASADLTKTIIKTITVIGAKTKDLNGDGAVDVLDLALMAKAYGSSDSATDLNADGTVDDADLTIFLTGF